MDFYLVYLNQLIRFIDLTKFTVIESWFDTDVHRKIILLDLDSVLRRKLVEEDKLFAELQGQRNSITWFLINNDLNLLFLLIKDIKNKK